MTIEQQWRHDGPIADRKAMIWPGQLARDSEFFVVAVVLLFTIAWSVLVQAPLTYNRGEGWDGVHYARMAEQCRAGQSLAADAPFIYRIALPCLAGRLAGSGPVVVGFYWAHLIAMAVNLLLLIRWLRRHLTDWRLRVLVAAAFITQWHGPFRFPFFMPIYIEPFTFIFILAALNLMPHRLADYRPLRIAALAALSLIGTLFREVVLIVPFTILIFVLIESRADLRRIPQRLLMIAGLPLLAGLIGFILPYLLVEPTSRYGFVGAAYFWAYTKPAPLYLQAFFVAFGPMVVLPLFFWRTSLRFLRERLELLVFLAIVLLLGWVGGTDSERFLYWAGPIVLLVAAHILAVTDIWSVARWPLLVIGATQALSQRLFLITPDYFEQPARVWPILTPLTGGGGVSSLMADVDAPDRLVGFAMLLQYLLLTTILLLWLWYCYRGRTRATP